MLPFFVPPLLSSTRFTPSLFYPFPTSPTCLLCVSVFIVVVWRTSSAMKLRALLKSNNNKSNNSSNNNKNNKTTATAVGTAVATTITARTTTIRATRTTTKTATKLKFCVCNIYWQSLLSSCIPYKVWSVN